MNCGIYLNAQHPRARQAQIFYWYHQRAQETSCVIQECRQKLKSFEIQQMLKIVVHVPARLRKFYGERDRSMSLVLQLNSRWQSLPWVEVMARSPWWSRAYNKLKPHVTLWGNCFVIKSSNMPNIHFFFKFNNEWSTSFSNLDSIICEVISKIRFNIDQDPTHSE